MVSPSGTSRPDDHAAWADAESRLGEDGSQRRLSGRGAVHPLHLDLAGPGGGAHQRAEVLGANLSSVLMGLAAESRERRVLKAEEIAASLPVKMVLPMALFVLPALFVMIFGAVAADYYAR